MKTTLLLFFLFTIVGSHAQSYLDYENISFSEDVLRELKLHGVYKLSKQLFKSAIPPQYIEEWEFSSTGKPIAYRFYRHSSDETDPYPTLPETVMQAPEDTIYIDLGNGKKRAQCVNYHFFNSYGIWRRSFYYPEYAISRHPWGDEMRYNEMQYAFDADSNLIYYRSNMDYVQPTTLHALLALVRYDTLGNITERIEYDTGIYEWSANWYPQFDTAHYERITYDTDAGTAICSSWKKYTATDYGIEPCDHCVNNRVDMRIDTLPIREPYAEPVDQPFGYPLSRKEERKRRRHPPPAVLFEGNRAVIGRYEYEVIYR